MQKFEGIIIKTENIPKEEICYAILIDKNKWLIPLSDARYLNHSCFPNCKINDDLDVITTHPVKINEELTFSYNTVYNGEDPGEWDPRWNFKCQCGSKNCQSIVDKYIDTDGHKWVPQINVIIQKV